MKLRVKILHSQKEKSKGLIGVYPIYPIYFSTRWGIHTFGLVCPIDVIILDNAYKVIKTQNLVPNRVFIWNPTFKHVIELPEGEIKRKNIKIGTKIYLYD